MINRIRTYILIGLIGVFTLSCGGSDDGPTPTPTPDPTPTPTPTPDPNEPPTDVKTLIYPTSDLLCINNTIDFDWSDATDPENDAITYRITIASDRDLTQIVEQEVVSVSQITLTLEKGAPFYWNVIAIDSENDESPASVTQAFYTSGDGTTNHAPFTAIIVAPGDESSVDAGTISLTWDGSDTDAGDALTFDLFFGELTDPPSLQEDLSVKTFDVTVESGKTYYWKVNTSDDSGAKSIGQVWEFTVN